MPGKIYPSDGTTWTACDTNSGYKDGYLIYNAHTSMTSMKISFEGVNDNAYSINAWGLKE